MPREVDEIFGRERDAARLPDGALDVLAWHLYAPLSSAVMSLGRDVTRTKVTAAMCTDARVRHATLNEEVNGAMLASHNCGWNLATFVTTFLTGSTSPC